MDAFTPGGGCDPAEACLPKTALEFFHIVEPLVAPFSEADVDIFSASLDVTETIFLQPRLRSPSVLVIVGYKRIRGGHADAQDSATFQTAKTFGEIADAVGDEEVFEKMLAINEGTAGVPEGEAVGNVPKKVGSSLWFQVEIYPPVKRLVSTTNVHLEGPC